MNTFKRHPGWAVTAAWGALNGILVGILALYHEDLLAVMLYVGAAVLVEIAALAVLVSSRRGPREHMRYRVPAGGGAAVPVAAAGLTIAALGFVYGFWLMSLAVPVLAVAAALAVHQGTWRRGPS
ncbi:hypothetical protein ACYF6T_40135 [Streptomyces sp. 7R007]